MVFNFKPPSQNPSWKHEFSYDPLGMHSSVAKPSKLLKPSQLRRTQEVRSGKTDRSSLKGV